MKNMRAQLEKLRRQAWECALLGRKADIDDERELFALLNTHLTALADHVENVMRITAAAEMLPMVTRKQAPQKRGRALS
jgi:hypothetical protein